MKKNEADWERIVRVILGIALIVVGFAVIGGTLGTILGIVGIIPLVTGAIGWCPLWAAFKINTRKDKA